MGSELRDHNLHSGLSIWYIFGLHSVNPVRSWAWANTFTAIQDLFKPDGAWNSEYTSGRMRLGPAICYGQRIWGETLTFVVMVSLFIYGFHWRVGAVTCYSACNILPWVLSLPIDKLWARMSLASECDMDIGLNHWVPWRWVIGFQRSAWMNDPVTR